jgi:hypothetical protein
MQSLGQAVYRLICLHSQEGRTGIGRQAIVEEMASRGYRPPLRERVEDALHDYNDFIAFKNGLFLKKVPYWKQAESSGRKRVKEVIFIILEQKNIYSSNL